MSQGNKQFLMLERDHRQGPMRVPLVEVTGAGDGPTLTIMAGAHGSEYVGITAAMRLAQTINPADLRGSLRIITIANVPAFFDRSMHICPIDGINMAGRFPGEPDGEYSDALASLIYERVVPGSDFIIDVHGGDLEERLCAYTSWTEAGNSKVDAVSERMAHAVDYPLILEEKKPDREIVRSSLYRAAVFKAGVPGVLIEAGKHGELQEDLVDLQQNAMTNVMKEFDMIDGQVVHQYTPCYLSEFVSVNSPEDGAFYPAVNEGDVVAEGASLGVLHDLFGKEVTTVISPVNAVVLGIITTTAMPRGAMVAGLGRLSNKFMRKQA